MDLRELLGKEMKIVFPEGPRTGYIVGIDPKLGVTIVDEEGAPIVCVDLSHIPEDHPGRPKFLKELSSGVIILWAGSYDRMVDLRGSCKFRGLNAKEFSLKMSEPMKVEV